MDNNPIYLTDRYGNCTDCDEHTNPNGRKVTTPNGTKVFKDVNGNVDFIKGQSGDLFFWNQDKGGYYSSGGDRYSNPNADWYDGPLDAIKGRIKGMVDAGSIEGRQLKGMKLANLYGLSSDGPSYSDDIKAIGLGIQNTYYGIIDGGLYDRTYIGTNIGIEVASLYAGYKGLQSRYTSVYRVQGKPLLLVENKNIVFNPNYNTTIYMTFGNKGRALTYLKQKGSGYNIVTFKMNSRYVKTIQNGASTQAAGKVIRGVAQSDYHRYGLTNLGIYPRKFNQFQKYIKPGSAKVIK